MKEYQVVWRGPVLDATGYGRASREYALALVRQGVDVKLEGYTWGFPLKGMNKLEKENLYGLFNKPTSENKQKVLIYHTPPAKISEKERIAYDQIILNTVWETTKIPDHWLPLIDQFDAVFVPCSQNVEAMINSGVKLPVFLVPHGVDTNRFHPQNKKLSIENLIGKFIFVSVFDFQHRKNPEALLKAYWEEFTADDQVALVVKTYGSGRRKIWNSIMNYKKKLGFGEGTAPLMIITGIIGSKKLKGIYTLGNAFVLPTRGEGVGMPFMEALSSGIPVITTGWGGQMDFLNEKNSFLIDYQLSYPGLSMNSEEAISKVYRGLFDGEGQLWAEADVNHLRKQMRYAFENPELCKQKGTQGSKDMLELSWDRAGISLKQAIEKVLG